MTAPIFFNIVMISGPTDTVSISFVIFEHLRAVLLSTQGRFRTTRYFQVFKILVDIFSFNINCKTFQPSQFLRFYFFVYNFCLFLVPLTSSDPLFLFNHLFYILFSFFIFIIFLSHLLNLFIFIYNFVLIHLSSFIIPFSFINLHLFLLSHLFIFIYSSFLIYLSSFFLPFLFIYLCL